MIALVVTASAGLDNGLGRTPLLGFNSWNVFACEVNETVMRDTMDAFVTLGLRDAGYDTVSVDDCTFTLPRVGLRRRLLVIERADTRPPKQAGRTAALRTARFKRTPSPSRPAWRRWRRTRRRAA